jgi:hypothetical protein
MADRDGRPSIDGIGHRDLLLVSAPRRSLPRCAFYHRRTLLGDHDRRRVVWVEMTGGNRAPRRLERIPPGSVGQGWDGNDLSLVETGEVGAQRS